MQFNSGLLLWMISFTGDDRANEWSGLAALHTIFVREHNRVAEKLHQLNGHWNGERLYQETRRINIANWQNIVYNHYLPIIVGKNAMRDHGLQLVNSGYWNGQKTWAIFSTFNILNILYILNKKLGS